MFKPKKVTLVVLSLALLFAMALSMAGCGGNGESEPEESVEPVSVQSVPEPESSSQPESSQPESSEEPSVADAPLRESSSSVAPPPASSTAPAPSSTAPSSTAPAPSSSSAAPSSSSRTDSRINTDAVISEVKDFCRKMMMSPNAKLTSKNATVESVSSKDLTQAEVVDKLTDLVSDADSAGRTDYHIYADVKSTGEATFYFLSSDPNVSSSSK